MTQDEIIEMAKQAGIEEAYSLKHNQYLVRFKDGSLEAFAKLVEEKALAEHAMQEVQRLGQEIEQEPLEYWNAVEGWVKIDEVREHFDSVGCATIYKTAGEGRLPLSLAKAQPEQEPVAYFHPHKGFYWAKPTSISAPTIADVEPLPLYSHPPKETT